MEREVCLKSDKKRNKSELMLNQCYIFCKHSKCFRAGGMQRFSKDRIEIRIILRQPLPFYNLDLDWEQNTILGDIEVIFTECRHRSGRGLSDQMKTLWGAFVIKTPEGNIYFGGDSGYGSHYSETGENHGPFALALLPIGAYEPRWFMADVHLDPEESVRAHLDLGSRNSVGVHFGTFQLTYEGREDPERDLEVAIEKFGLEDGVFRVIDPGETLYWPRAAL